MCEKIENKSILNKSAKYYLCIGITLALCYGFTLTHFSVGVDDESFRFWFYEGGLVENGGRWIQPFLAQFIDAFEFLPFWRDFLGLILQVWGAHLIFRQLNKIAQNRFDENAEIIFVCLTMSCTYMANKFVFAMTTVIQGILFISQGLLIKTLHNYTNKHTLSSVFGLMAAAIFARIVGETGVMLGLVCGGLALTLYLIYSEKKIKFLQIFIDVVVFAGCLLVAMGVYSFLTDLILAAYGLENNNYTSNQYIRYDPSNFIASLIAFIKSVPGAFLRAVRNENAMKVYSIFSALFMGLGALGAWRRKQISILLATICCAISPFAIYAVTGNVNMPGRMIAYLGVYVGAAAITVYQELADRQTALKVKKREFHVKYVLIIVVVWSVFAQSNDMNTIFYNDYLRYQRDVSKMDAIYEDIQAASKNGTTQPVLFVGVPDGYSLLDSGDGETVSQFALERAFSTYDELTSPRVYRFFQMHGLNIQPPYSYDEATVRAQAATMTAWPAEGSVCQFGEYIIVNFSDPLFEKLERDEVEKILADSADNGLDSTGYLDTFSFDGKSLSASGWAIIPGKTSQAVSINLYAIGDANACMFRVNVVNRPDITNYMAQGIDYEKSGFSCGQSVAMLEEGTYKLMIGLNTGETVELLDLQKEIEVTK